MEEIQKQGNTSNPSKLKKKKKVHGFSFGISDKDNFGLKSEYVNEKKHVPAQQDLDPSYALDCLE